MTPEVDGYDRDACGNDLFAAGSGSVGFSRAKSGGILKETAQDGEVEVLLVGMTARAKLRARV